jgi:hypothetical protein
MQQRGQVNNRFSALHGRAYGRYIGYITNESFHIIRPGAYWWWID